MTSSRRRRNEASPFYWLRLWLFLPYLRVMTPRQLRRALDCMMNYITSGKRDRDARQVHLDVWLDGDPLPGPPTELTSTVDDAWDDFNI